MAIGNVQFLKFTGQKPSISPTNINVGSQGAANYYQGNNYTVDNPKVGLPETSDMEKAIQFLEGQKVASGYNPQNPTIQPVMPEITPMSTKGALWGKDFKVPPKNNDAELHPDVSGREDSLGLLKEYYA